MKHIVETKL